MPRQIRTKKYPRTAILRTTKTPLSSFALSLALTTLSTLSANVVTPALAQEQGPGGVGPQVITLRPLSVKPTKGELSQGSSNAASTEDDGKTFAEISPGRGRTFVATFEYAYSGDVSKVKSVEVRMNSRGEGWDRQRRTFQIRAKRSASEISNANAHASSARPRPTRRNPGGMNGAQGGGPGKAKARKFRWIKLADNRDAPSPWEWQSQSWTLEGGTGRTELKSLFSNAGKLRIRVKSNNAANVMHLDYIVVDLHVDAAPTSAAGSWWKPKASSKPTWQWQLTGKLDLSYDVTMYDVDLFDTPVESIKELQSRGIKVICYFSAGSYEDWRADWLEHFPGGLETMPLAGKMSEWEEFYLDITKLDDLRPIMSSRLELAAEKGCDGVEPDNMDAYSNHDETGIPLSYNDQLTYNRWIANRAHEYGLSVALKNDVDQLEDLVDYFDFAINEECFQYRECGRYKVFTERDKAVFNAEYKGNAKQFCRKARKFGLSSMKKKMALTEWRVSCGEVLGGGGKGKTKTTTTKAPPAQPEGDWWRPRASDKPTWQWQLSGHIDTSDILDVDMYDVDLFDTPVETIQLLQGKGIVVICYFSAGSHEDWRTDWKEHFPDGADEVTAGKMGEWDEHWLDISKLELLRPIMTERIKLAKEKGCDGVEPDNVDAYTNGDDTGISLSYDDQLSYNTMIATVAHEHGLSVALKNDVEQIADLVEHFDFAVNEECHQWKECDLYEGFTERDKAVFGVEYELDKEDFCPRAREKGLSFMKKKWDLDAWREPC